MTCSARRSSWICVSASLVMALAAAHAHAQTNALEVSFADREQVVTEPRQVVATTFSIHNGSGRDVEVEARLRLPTGWQPITPDTTFDLANGATVMKLAGFTVPEDAPSGTYDVRYEVADRGRQMSAAVQTLRVTVKATPRVQIVPLESPDFVIAGASYSDAFLIQNVGNAPVTVTYHVRGRGGLHAEPSQGSLSLERGESKRVDVTVATTSAHQRAQGRLAITAEIIGGGLVANAGSSVQLVPRVSALDAYHTLGSRAGMNFVARDGRAGRTSGWQPEFSGSGLIDEENRRYLSFHVRGPDVRDRGSLGASEEYWVRLESDHTTAVVGDFSYGLSHLTDPGRYGRGGLVSYRETQWGAAAFEMNDAYSKSAGGQRGLNAWYRPTSATRIDANLLDKHDATLSGTVLSLRTRTQWAENLDSDVELGASDGDAERGRAVRGALYDNRFPVRYYALGWAADPQFRGYLRDKKYLSSGFDFDRPRGWGLRGFYRLQNWNLTPLEEIDPDELEHRKTSDFMRSAPLERQASLGTDRSIGRGTQATLDYTLRTRTGDSAGSDVDVIGRAWRAGLTRSWQEISLHYSFERGASLNRISNARFGTSMHMLAASWRAGRTQSYSLYATRDENTFSDEPESARTSYGLSAAYAPGFGTSLTFDAQRNQSKLGHSGTYSFALVHERPDGASVRLAARRLEGRFARTDLLLSCSMPFSLPVLRKANVSALRGRVFDAQSGDGMSDVLLRLDGLTAVTNRRGEFAFPAVRAGAHQLTMDRANVEVARVPATALPREIEIAGRVTPPLDIAMVHAVAIGLTVKLHPPEPDPARPAGGVLVVLTNGELTFRRLTDTDGHVRLGGLPPGTWRVSVDTGTVQQGYVPAVSPLELEIAPGTSATAEFPLLPVKRAIRMLPPLSSVSQPRP